MPEKAFQKISHSEAETEALAGCLAGVLPPGMVLLLDGDLGVGKSVVARGIIRGFGVAEAYITSPTFTLLNTYEEGRVPVHHFDLYRLPHPDALVSTGAEECLDGDGVVLVEWAERGGDWFPADHMRIRLEYIQFYPEWRLIRVSARGALACQVLHAFQLQYAHV